MLLVKGMALHPKAKIPHDLEIVMIGLLSSPKSLLETVGLDLPTPKGLPSSFSLLGCLNLTLVDIVEES